MNRAIAILIAASFLLVFVAGAEARTWSTYDCRAAFFGLGSYPTMALINGSQPVIANGAMNGSIYQLTAFGWSGYSQSGYFIAGDGRTKIVAGDTPVKYGRDGEFYSTAGFMPSPYYWGSGIATRLENGVWMDAGAATPYFYPASWGVSTADARGTVYVSSVGYVADSGGGANRLPLAVTTDIAVSPFGDVAVSGYAPSGNMVSWYDYALGTWDSKTFGTISGSNYYGKVSVDFDRKGNLGVAYVNNARELHFAYLDMSENYWTDEVVCTIGTYPSSGTVLSFNYQDLPVVGAGYTLAYDPVPEPLSLAVFSLSGLWLIRRRMSGRRVS